MYLQLTDVLLFVGDVPLDPAIMSSSDSGKPILMTNPDSEISRIYQAIAQQIVDKLSYSIFQK